MEDYESLQYFQRVLIQSGIIKKLEDMGINDMRLFYENDVRFLHQF